MSKGVENFKSLRGYDYKVLSTNNDIMVFERLSSNIIWRMNLVAVYNAYKNLTVFKTKNFKPYVNRTQSPALGLLIKLNLLRKG